MKNPQKGLFWQAILILRHDMMHFAPFFVALGCHVKNMQLPIFFPLFQKEHLDIFGSLKGPKSAFCDAFLALELLQASTCFSFRLFNIK